jgi:LL-diaminopimelate aminotransferase
LPPHWGGTDAPYIWWKTPNDLTSWEFFDILLKKCQLISVPGSGFGKCGEGYVRLSAFTTAEKAQEALRRIEKI